MATVVVYTATIGVGASASAEVDLGDGEFNRFAVALPQVTSVFTTEVVDTTMQGTPDDGTTYFTIGYSNNPATATSGFRAWEAGQDAFGSMVICEAALFSPKVRLKFSSAATAAGDCYIFAGKE
jgi:hypothetical protein